MTRICFILDELYPADRGGIARLMHNIIHHAKQADKNTDIHIVLAREPADDTGLLDHFSEIATLHFFRPEPEAAAYFGLTDLEVSALFTKQAPPFRHALRVLHAALLAADECGGFDHIEIPDHMGLGAIILQARQSGFAFQNSQITCRIHSTLSVIITAEPFHHLRGGWLAPRLEMERYSLEQADRVIAHLPAIAKYNQTHFGFDDAWLDKVEVAFPPVIWPVPQAPKNPLRAQDFLFTSRFQPLKRPALFIKAAITMLEAGTAFQGKFKLVSYGFDLEYIDYLRLSIPARFQSRIRIETTVSSADRLAAIRSSIIVQPSKFESLCALAYEVSAEMRPLLLARDCPAFANDPHWKDGENCLLFEPTPTGLAATMEKALEWQPRSCANSAADPAYFTQPARMPAAQATHRPSLLVGPVQDQAAFVRIAKHLAPLEGEIGQIIAFGNTPIDPTDTPVRFHKFTDLDFRGSQWRILAQNTKSDTIILCTPETLPTAGFIDNGQASTRPGTAYSANGREEATGKMIVYSGKFNSMSIAEPRICPPCIMLHQQDLGLIDTTDDQDLMARLITRIARSDISLALGPAPLVALFSPRPSAPSLRHLGFDTAPYWPEKLRWIGVDVPSGTREDLLVKQPFSLSLVAKDTLICSKDQPCDIISGPPQAYALEAGRPIESRILTLQASNNGKAGDIAVSLQQSAISEALDLHSKGRNLRILKPGQSYRMRWGPIRQDAPLTLVISSPKPLPLRLSAPIILSID
ncbi:MAG: hypothetical protein L3J37_10615 [Rhodobacteraceae bacterium]|nr:hypothetical protein [Paracoccaceae bacterium]